MRQQLMPKDYEHMSPAGAEIRVLIGNDMAGVVHCTLRKGVTSKPVSHKTVSEIWHVVSGAGEIWRKQGNTDSITTLTPGVTIDIPLGTDFQYRSAKDSDLVFICITTPPWPGFDEAFFVSHGAWDPSN